jgi:hypothetical protein
MVPTIFQAVRWRASGLPITCMTSPRIGPSTNTLTATAIFQSTPRETCSQ